MATEDKAHRHNPKEYVAASARETFQIGREFGLSLTAPSIVAFYGNLGAGKTTFIRGLAAAAGVNEREVCSPTFVYLNIYKGRMPIYHFDLYRLHSSQEFFTAGFDEFLQADGICCIEWSEKIEPELPPDIYKVVITAISQQLRAIVIS